MISWAAEPLSRKRGNSRGWIRRKMEVIRKSSFLDPSGSLRRDFIVYTVPVINQFVALFKKKCSQVHFSSSARMAIWIEKKRIIV